ncbi:MAG: hypothetical protein GY787_19810 [Alteromonadales bacterium]|nr:hypothetical protein [Alteromonadales bacterium]
MASQPTWANSIENLNWLPLLTASMKSFQPDRSCPSNKITDLKVDKQQTKIVSSIGEVIWDINCFESSNNNETALSNKQKSEKISLLLTQLSNLPSFKLDFNAINLVAKMLKRELTSKLSIDKSGSQLVVDINSELLTGQIKLNLHSKRLNVDATVEIDKLSTYIHLSEVQKDYLTSPLTISYHSDLKQWFKGGFSVDWQGTVKDISEDVTVSIAGELNMFTEQLSVTNLSINAKNVTIQLSDSQSWKTGYIKLKTSEPASLDFAKFQLEKLPLQLRTGSSQILTKVERGKSKRIRIDKQKLPPLFLQLAASGKTDDLLVDWRLVLLNQKLQGKLSVTQKLIKLEMVESQINLGSLITSVAKYVEGLDLVVIEKGLIQLDLSSEYDRINKTVSFESRLNSDEIAGKKDDMLFDGLYISSWLHYYIDAQKTITIHEDKQQLKVANLFVGVPIQALQLDAQIAAGKPVVQHFKARLLGGRVDFDDFKLDAPSQTVLNISGVNLSEVIKYSAYPEIGIKGIIDGMLPLTLTTTGPEINDGFIFARPPGGYIKVPKDTVTKAMGGASPALALTLQILSNFQFEAMQGKIGYTSDGESDLKVEIKGISPKVSGINPINFNYSHSENILKLLKSLRFNDELVRDIKERY